jgi:hypothetical protein
MPNPLLRLLLAVQLYLLGITVMPLPLLMAGYVTLQYYVALQEHVHQKTLSRD